MLRKKLSDGEKRGRQENNRSYNEKRKVSDIFIHLNQHSNIVANLSTTALREQYPRSVNFASRSVNLLKLGQLASHPINLLHEQSTCSTLSRLVSRSVSGEPY
jgi:hypothetical protein